nr:hypothetical protein [Tanacetum cinerariifolium]
MDMTIDQQVVLGEALVPHARRLRITPFFKAFLVTADVLEIYMQDIWATATVHHHSIRFKMDNKKHIFNLEYFREMLHICPRLPGQTFNEPPFEEEILAFLRFLRHSGAIKRLTDVNINKLHQPWRSFAAIINKCLSEKSSGYDSLWLSQGQFLWGFYHKRNVDFAYDLSIPKRNKVNWHYVRDDQMFTTIKLVSRHQNTQQFGAMLPIELTNVDIRNSEAYKEYYVVATGATPPNTNASVQKTKSSFDTTVTPPPTAAAGTKLFTSPKGKQPATTSKAKSLTTLSEGFSIYQLTNLMKKFLGSLVMKEKMMMMMLKMMMLKMMMVIRKMQIKMMMIKKKGMMMMIKRNDYEQDYDKKGKEFIHPSLSTHDEEETRDEESFEPILKTPENTDDEGNGEENLRLKVSRKEGQDEEDDTDDLYKDVKINLKERSIQTADVHTTQEFEDSHVTLTLVNPDGQQQTDKAQAGNDKFLKTIDENMHNILKEQVKEQVKVQFSKILSKIEQIVNEKLKVEVLTRSSNSSKTSYAVAADLSEMELKKILIEKIEGNKDIVMMMRTKMKNPSLDQTGGPRDEEKEKSQKEPMQTTYEMEKPSHLEFKTDRDWNKTLPATHESIQPWIRELENQTDSRSSFNELMDTHVDFLTFLMNLLKVDTLTLELLAGPTYELMKGSCKSLVELEFFLEEPLPLIPNSQGSRVILFDYFINNDLDYLRGGYDKHALWGISHWGRKRQQFYGFAVNWESARDVYSKRRTIAVIELKIVEWHNYKHLDWITVSRDDDKLYKFKKGDFKRLRI